MIAGTGETSNTRIFTIWQAVAVSGSTTATCSIDDIREPAVVEFDVFPRNPFPETELDLDIDLDTEEEFLLYNTGIVETYPTKKHGIIEIEIRCRGPPVFWWRLGTVNNVAKGKYK